MSKYQTVLGALAQLICTTRLPKVRNRSTSIRDSNSISQANGHNVLRSVCKQRQRSRIPSSTWCKSRKGIYLPRLALLSAELPENHERCSASRWLRERG